MSHVIFVKSKKGFFNIFNVLLKPPMLCISVFVRLYTEGPASLYVYFLFNCFILWEITTVQLILLHAFKLTFFSTNVMLIKKMSSLHLQNTGKKRTRNSEKNIIFRPILKKRLNGNIF